MESRLRSKELPRHSQDDNRILCEGDLDTHPESLHEAAPAIECEKPVAHDPCCQATLANNLAVASRVRRIVLRNMRGELPDDKFLKEIDHGSFASSDQRVFKHQCCSAIFLRVVKI